jgi:hypothetical protein
VFEYQYFSRLDGNSNRRIATMPSKRDKTDHSKPCSLCATRRDVLIRCQIDESGKWHLICTGKCWKDVSGGVVDGDGAEEHKFYHYGGMWKNKHEAVSAKKPKGVGLMKEAGDSAHSDASDGSSSSHVDHMPDEASSKSSASAESEWNVLLDAPREQ